MSYYLIRISDGTQAKMFSLRFGVSKHGKNFSSYNFLWSTNLSNPSPGRQVHVPFESGLAYCAHLHAPTSAPVPAKA